MESPEYNGYQSMGMIYKNDDSFEDLWPPYCNPSYTMPERIEVKVVANPGGETYFFPVIIVKAINGKAYLGGYRNKITGQKYHHASSQTPVDQTKAQNKSRKIASDAEKLRSRQTQTTETRTLSVQPYRESGTQMEREDLVIDSKRDTIRVSRPYFTADELLLLKKRKVIEIQRCWRGYMARGLARITRQKNLDLQIKTQMERDIELAAQKEQHLKDMAKRTHPKSNSDFVVLYNELDQWRQAEIAKIKATVSDPEARKEAMAALLQNETKALQSMQMLKMNAQRELHSEKTQQMLERMAQPHQWQLSKGDVALVSTPETQRAKELLELFNAFNNTTALTTTEQRLDVLLNIKWTVSEFNSPLTRDIKDLADREADLLNRGRPQKSMEKLRKRMQNLFLEFLQNPEYNPRAKDFIPLYGGGEGASDRDKGATEEKEKW